jgi:ribose 5-phosphate isomerase B
LKDFIAKALKRTGHAVVDCGARSLVPDDDYPGYAWAVGEAVRDGRAERGIVICGSGVGAAIAANKLRGLRAGLCHDTYSARQGVEDDDMNVICLGGRVVGEELAWELVRTFLAARFSGADRHRRRVREVAEREEKEALSWNRTR